ncbi:MAG: hypothetical protein J6K14_09035 [Clostridia bacterium]|nr:hypothetical protein [Clostridia bacterium]
MCSPPHKTKQSPKQHNRWICVALQLNSFRNFAKQSPSHTLREGRKLFLRSTLCSHSACGTPTHVFIANPTEGYGIFIENMLSDAQNEAIPKAA